MPEATVLSTQTPAPQATTEAPKTPPVETKPPETKPPVSDGFAALAKKEKNIYQKSREVAQQEAQLKADQAKTKAEQDHWSKVKREARDNPLAALKELGLEYKDVTDYILNHERPTADMQLQKVYDELKATQAKIDENEKKANERVEQFTKEQNDRVLQQFQNNINAFIEEKKDEYDAIYGLQYQNLVFQGINDAYEKTGKIPTIKEAADGVQSYLVSYMERVIPTLKWFKDKYQAREVKEIIKTPDGSVATKTLTNDMARSTTGLPAQTEEERVKRALAALDATP